MSGTGLADALASADPVAVLLAWLKSDSRVTALLGGGTHISGLSEAPWPHLSVADGPTGDLRDLLWDVELEVALTLTGAPNGSPGQASLRASMIRILTYLVWMTEDAAVADMPVVCRVRPSGVMAYTPLSTGQPRITSGVMVVIHPATL